MTVQEVYYAALALLGEPQSSSGDYETDVILGKVNVLLAELRPYDNALRAAEGLEDVPMQTVSSMGDELQLMERTARLPMTYGLASGLAYDDDETGKASYFLQLKDEQLTKFMPAKVGSITDVY